MAGITRRLKISDKEAGLLYNIISVGENQKGHTRESLRQIDPIMNQFEDQAEVKEVGNGNTAYRFNKEIELALKESEYAVLKKFFENSTGYFGASRKEIFALEEKINETPALEEPKKEN